MNESPLPEPLDNFLRHPPRLPMQAETQEAILAQTAHRLRRPRGRRRWPLPVALAAGLAAAAVTIYLLRPGQDEPAPRQDLVEHKIAPPPLRPQPDRPKPQIPHQFMHPRQLEWVAFDAEDDQERVRLYFQAGNLYLDKHNDLDAALRCYHQALHYADAGELEFNPDDNWLVMALKRDHRKEN